VTPLLAAGGLSRSFGGLKAVDGVDLAVPAGEIRAIIGPNGAGKTTLVGLICGRIVPTGGRIHFDGQDITDVPAHLRVQRGIAYTFQITSIFANLTVFDNVALAVQRKLTGGAVHPAALRRSTLESLARVGLAERAQSIAGNLAYGHQRLLEVAMGLSLRPRLLILDEPTQGLSDHEIEGFLGLVREIAREATVLLIEHNMDVVMQLADSITVMDQGRVLAEGAPSAIRADAAVQHAYLGTPVDE
jgi:branched-chain amino acid transport system ATP-binding protein